ncbi:MAG: gamma-glutamyl-gamma-aminobutyrate hydrolase family protein [Firmicutes bacterium]|nr:gamma-glutamyl-gamma-aminobutyrate hydrolase family protein [Bacillota bacterium]
MKSKQPLIGLVCGHQRENPDRYYVNNAYIQAVISAGGTPILIPYQPKEQIRALIELLDGLVLPGGIDVDPNRYGQNPVIECGEIDPYWDELDLTAAGFALERDIPVLAICRGIQVLNIALGGSLVQDIPSQITEPIKHTQEAPRWYATHDVSIQSGSMLKEIWGTAPTRVNSYHHQAVGSLGKGLRVVATAPDGVIEAVESGEHRFVLGVQWHPELMVEHYPAARRIFSHFVLACTAN